MILKPSRKRPPLPNECNYCGRLLFRTWRKEGVLGQDGKVYCDTVCYERIQEKTPCQTRR